MFKLVKERLVWQKVVFPGITEEGKRIDNEVEMQFRLLDTDENRNLFKDARELMEIAFAVTDISFEETGEASDKGQELSQRYAQFGMRFICDWRKIAEANGDAIKFSEENLVRFFKVTGTFIPVIRAYGDALNGRVREKNSSSSHEDGRADEVAAAG